MTLRIRIRRFRVISTPSGGQKWRKTWFFRVLLNRKSPRHLGDGSWKQKMFVYDIYKHFLFSQLKIFSLKIFHNGQGVAKNGKKRIFLAFCLIENHRDILEMGRGNKKCLFLIYKHFLFSQLKIFPLKIFHDGQGS